MPATHKERTRARILDEAAKAMRVRGHEGIGVADVMKRAGLTHGGFYAHFKSRDDLVAATIDRMFEDSRSMRSKYLQPGDPRESLAAMIDYYLSDDHRHRVATGCPVAAMSSEAARMPKAARERFEEGLRSFRGGFVGPIKELGFEDPEAVATSVVAEMVGALALSRAFTDETTASGLLERSRGELKRRLGLLN
jgi:TetR/AcrR family transcriptional regulator, transcriptional repressor for nem operon